MRRIKVFAKDEVHKVFKSTICASIDGASTLLLLRRRGQLISQTRCRYFHPLGSQFVLFSNHHIRLATYPLLQSTPHRLRTVATDGVAIGVGVAVLLVNGGGDGASLTRSVHALHRSSGIVVVPNSDYFSTLWFHCNVAMETLQNLPHRNVVRRAQPWG